MIVGFGGSRGWPAIVRARESSEALSTNRVPSVNGASVAVVSAVV